MLSLCFFPLLAVGNENRTSSLLHQWALNASVYSRWILLDASISSIPELGKKICILRTLLASSIREAQFLLDPDSLDDVQHFETSFVVNLCDFPHQSS